MIYDSTAQKQLVLAALGAYSVPIGQSRNPKFNELVQQIVSGDVTESTEATDAPEPPSEPK